MKNGKRSFSVSIIAMLAWAPGPCAPITETEAMIALGWIFRALVQWRQKTKANVYDMMRFGGGCGHSYVPSVMLEEHDACGYLRGLLARLAAPECHPEFVRFARAKLGFRSITRPLLVPVRKPGGCVFGWLRTLYGCQLKKSPNQFHAGAVWLHGAKLCMLDGGPRWRLSITYSYRHEDSSWRIGLDQIPGEKLEDFDARAWQWLSEQIKWRHPEQFYHGFFVPADGMKRNELTSCERAEQEMHAVKKNLAGIFYWGKGTPGFWENEVAEPMVYDVSEQFRAIQKIEMTGTRLRTLKKWRRDDRRSAKNLNAKEGA